MCFFCSWDYLISFLGLFGLLQCTHLYFVSQAKISTGSTGQRQGCRAEAGRGRSPERRGKARNQHELAVRKALGVGSIGIPFKTGWQNASP